MKRILFGALMALSVMAEAKVVLPNHLTSNMVIQQQTTMKIKGTAKPGSKVTLTASWNKKAVSAQTDGQGAFSLEIATPKAGGPFTMTFDDGEKTILNNVLAGEVWLGSGQSNMEMPLEGWGKVLNYEQEVAGANYPQIRLLQVKKTTSIKPLDNAELNMGGWQVCTPDKAYNFSALCYFYAVRLWEELGIPVGIIDDDWGGTPCESWVSAEGLTNVMGYEKQMKRILEVGQDADKVREYYQEVNADYARLETEMDPGLKLHWYNMDVFDTNWKTMNVPCKWEGIIGNFDGSVWFRRWVEVPEEDCAKAARVELSTLDDLGTLYWNGVQIGETKQILLPCDFDVPAELVQAGKNLITVRLYDTGGDGGMVANKENMVLKLNSGKQIPLAGEWKYNVGVNMKDLPSRPLDITNSHHPSVLFNAMINPLKDFPIRGVIWYQGCSNVGRGAQHEALFQTLITDWRKQFNNPEMPFYFVQLANYLQPRDVQPDSEWALLRETQAAALALPNTGMAVNIDLGDANDIHPKTKRELGRRLSAIALNKTYGKKCACTAPTYDGYTVEKGNLRVHLSAANDAEPLVQEQNVSGFIVKGTDGKWYKATGKTDGNDVIVSCPEVKTPIAVRYGWADNPTCTLRTASGLHVAPFRSDKGSM